MEFQEYHNEFGIGWHLYNEIKQPTDYYIFLDNDSDKYELFYGNGFRIIDNKKLIDLQNITIKLFLQFPRMLNVKDFDAQEFHAIKNFAKN